MATATRSFIVFKDEPEAAPTPAVEKKENQTGPSATYVIAPPPGPLLVYAPDKENIDPLTGTRSSMDQASGKKRKTALTVKAQPTSPTKRLKPLAEKTAKKPTSKSRGSDKKVKRTVSKRVASTRVHREPSLPRVTEENEVANQAVIDSKCKDLTVLPLADISEAHDVSVTKEDSGARGEPTAVKDTHGEVCALPTAISHCIYLAMHRLRRLFQRSRRSIQRFPRQRNAHPRSKSLPPVFSPRPSASASIRRSHSRRPLPQANATQRLAVPV